MGGELTVSERILFHISGYTKYEDKYEAPFDITQDGISQACAISRAHAAIELKKLKAAGIVDERLSHVRRGKARRKVYFLTFEGKARASKVIQYVKENGISPMVDPGRIAADSASSRARSAKKSSPLPLLKDFFGRERELEAARKAFAEPAVKVLAIKGIAGIGKTTLASKLASELSGQRVFWYAAKPWDAQRTLGDALGKFFAENSCRRLAAYLSSGKFELGELSYLLDEELAENGFTLVFDDADCSDVVQEFLKMLKHNSGSAKIVVTIESEQKFYESTEVVAAKKVAELELGGLDRKAALELLRSRGIHGEVASELVESTQGHPLSLEMVTEGSPTEARYQVARFFEEKFYAALPPAEKSLLQLASVYQRPFPLDAIPKELRQARKGSMLREVSPGRFEIHASLRSFVHGSMSKEEKTRWHSAAADHYLSTGEQQDRLCHLIRANRLLEAEMMVARLGEELLAQGNVRRLWDILASFEPVKPKYSQAVLLTKAKAASLVGRYDFAQTILNRLAESADDKVAAEALVELGRIASKKGDLSEASVYFAHAMERARELPGERAKALRGLGVVEGKLGNYAKAQELLERSALDALAAMDSKGNLLAHLELGNVFIGRGMFEEAIGHFSKCAPGFGPVDLTNVYINMGVAGAYLGRLDEARLNLENAVRLADETGQPRSKAYALTSLADVLVRSGSPELAREHCYRALEVLTEVGDRLGTSAAYANLGIAERALGDLRSSEEHFAESIASLEGMGVPRSMGQRKLEFGLLLQEKGDLDRARRMLDESMELFRRIGADDMLSRVAAELKRIDGQKK